MRLLAPMYTADRSATSAGADSCAAAAARASSARLDPATTAKTCKAASLCIAGIERGVRWRAVLGIRIWIRI